MNHQFFSFSLPQLNEYSFRVALIYEKFSEWNSFRLWPSATTEFSRTLSQNNEAVLIEESGWILLVSQIRIVS